jgi:hypothetical protein
MVWPLSMATKCVPSKVATTVEIVCGALVLFEVVPPSVETDLPGRLRGDGDFVTTARGNGNRKREGAIGRDGGRIASVAEQGDFMAGDQPQPDTVPPSW